MFIGGMVTIPRKKKTVVLFRQDLDQQGIPQSPKRMASGREARPCTILRPWVIPKKTNNIYI